MVPYAGRRLRRDRRLEEDDQGSRCLHLRIEEVRH